MASKNGAYPKITIEEDLRQRHVEAWLLAYEDVGEGETRPAVVDNRLVLEAAAVAKIINIKKDEVANLKFRDVQNTAVRVKDLIYKAIAPPDQKK